VGEPAEVGRLVVLKEEGGRRGVQQGQRKGWLREKQRRGSRRVWTQRRSREHRLSGGQGHFRRRHFVVIRRDQTLDGEGALGPRRRGRRRVRLRGWHDRRAGRVAKTASEGRGRRGGWLRGSRAAGRGEKESVHVGQRGQLVLQTFLVRLHQLEALPAAQKAAVFEHVQSGRVEGPVGALAGPVRPPGDLDEAVVEGKVVAQRVLPALRVLAVVRKALHDEAVDVGQRQHLLRRAPDGHRRQRDVRVGRLLVAVRFAARTRHRRSIMCGRGDRLTFSPVRSRLSHRAPRHTRRRLA